MICGVVACCLTCMTEDLCGRLFGGLGAGIDAALRRRRWGGGEGRRRQGVEDAED